MIEIYNKNANDVQKWEYQGNGIYSDYKHQEKVRFDQNGTSFFVPFEQVKNFVSYKYTQDLQAVYRVLLRYALFVLVVGSIVFSTLSFVFASLLLMTSPGFAACSIVLNVFYFAIVLFILRGIKTGIINLSFTDERSV